MFGLMRYKSDDFIGNSSSNNDICAVLLSFLIYRSCRSRVTREYKLHGLSELIHLDKSCIDGRMEVHVDNVMLCTYRASDYFFISCRN